MMKDNVNVLENIDNQIFLEYAAIAWFKDVFLVHGVLMFVVAVEILELL